ncbi:MAG: PPi-type phosphoenolpyruvate carboxykinase [Proteobacteria bacterium]|nr:PPi-type phosphoenolpyruvate carboxykinase [Pseudomonadota bacterium]
MDTGLNSPVAPSDIAAEDLNAAINLRLALLGLPLAAGAEEAPITRLMAPILARQRELSRRLSDRLCPADTRIQSFLKEYLADVGPAPQLPGRSLVLDQAGLARAMSLPAAGDFFKSPLLSSYRLRNGVLHNPANDRRTTAGVFHIAEGGLPVPDDKLAVPKLTFAKLLAMALNPPPDSLQLPFTAGQAAPAMCFVSLLLRPLVVPAVPGFTTEKRMETRFFVPGGLVANLDFVESIFGNAGDPYLPENDASLDPDSWTGHTGCVILAPHLTHVPKHLLGLPHWDAATPLQRRDGMCYKSESELYNGGNAFKLCARDARGVILTIIADNYFGYCKKEIKTQISYSANLFGSAEEEHSGGALVFPSYNEGLEYTDLTAGDAYSLGDVLARDGDRFALQPQGHALDRTLPQVVLVPEKSTFSLRTQTVSWPSADGQTSSIKLLAGKTYIGPNGYRMQMEPPNAERRQWSLVGTSADVTVCHKPSTVSGGGKSEISKAISDAILVGSVYVADFEKDMDSVTEILARDFSDRFCDPEKNGIDHRLILSAERSMGSVIKLLTPSTRDYNDDYNAWLRAIPQHVKELVFVVKRFHRPEWGDDWRSHYSLDTINGRPGNSLKLDGSKLYVNTLRVGFEKDGSWRVFGLRHDFHPAIKVQTEDDITASVVAPGGEPEALSRKYVQNCEYRLFQRPDDAIHRGYDRQAEADIAQPGNFISNFEPLDGDDARELVDDAIGFGEFTAPMQQLIAAAAQAPAASSPAYFVSSAHPRLVGGKPSKNPRYLQLRSDIACPQETAIADLAMRLYRRQPTSAPLITPVHVVAAGRRNNPPEDGIHALCPYNPLHYMELPELFIEFISSMTGKSPSTTGAGSEGALTKGPFNALPAIIDLNAAFVSFALTGYDGWVSSAGYVGPNVRVDHDVSLLIPEMFARMRPSERDAKNLIARGALERVADFEHRGQPVLASRLGYRMTARLASVYFGRIFLHPHAVFTDEMLRPELQDMDIFADGVANIVATHQRVAESYFTDGSIALACPPLKALLEIMAHGKTAEGLGLEADAVRSLFTRESVLASDWYAARLDAKQHADEARVKSAMAALYDFLDRPGNSGVAQRLGLAARRAEVQAERVRVGSAEYRAGLVGTLGLQPL